MKPSKALRIVAVTLCAIASVFGLAACSSSLSGGSGGVAATVNGVEISEQTITDYIEDFRAAQGLQEEQAWGAWMAMYGEDPAAVRNDVIDFYVDEELTKQAAEENGITVTDEEIQAQIDQTRAQYPSDEAWQSALESAGTTEDQYRDRLRTAMLEQKLEEKVVSSDTEKPSDEELLEYVQAYAPAFNGAKRSSHILFNSNDAETAQKVLDQINNGEITFEDAVAEYSEDTASAENGGDVGWDLLNSFVTEYTDALAGLDKDQVSELVTSEYGIHIIKCTDVFEAPEEITSIDQVPSELVDYISSMLASSNQSTAFTEWKNKYKEDADIVINDMPEGLPYAIDMTPYKTEEATDADAAAAGTETAEGEGTGTEAADAEAAGEETAAAEGDAAATAETEANGTETEADAAAEGAKPEQETEASESTDANGS